VTQSQVKAVRRRMKQDRRYRALPAEIYQKRLKVQIERSMKNQGKKK